MALLVRTRSTKLGKGLILLVFALAVAGCTTPSTPAATSASRAPAQSTTLVMVVNTEVSNLARKAVGPTNPDRTTRIFNADLTLVDAKGEVRPYMAESLPQLNTDEWRVFPDGRMESVWKLQPGLTWHDGQPLTAEDFVFAFGIYKAPDLAGVFETRPQDAIDRLVAVDPRTIRIYWRSPFFHTGDGLAPLPRAHLSEAFAAFEQNPAGQRDAFMALRFWRSEYVGAGPFRLTNWEPSSHFEGEAFEGHALGRPKIDRVVIRLINDENTVLANMMAGQGVHLSMMQAIRFEDGMILRRQGGFNDVEKKGRVLFLATSVTSAVPQYRSEYQQAPGLLDLRVRKAIAHAIDKDSINEALFEGQATVPWTLVPPTVAYYAEVDRAISKYPYDPRRTEQLMIEAGYARGRDGFFANAAGERFRPSIWNSAGDQRQQLLAILLNTWQQAGIDTDPLVMPAALERDQQARATFPGILVHGLGLGQTEAGAAQNLAKEQIASPANRWGGQNRGGWSNPGFDTLWERYNGSLDHEERIQAVTAMMKFISEQVANFGLHYSLNVVSHLAALRGPEGDATHWNIHEWEMTP